VEARQLPASVTRKKNAYSWHIEIPLTVDARRIIANDGNSKLIVFAEKSVKQHGQLMNLIIVNSHTEDAAAIRKRLASVKRFPSSKPRGATISVLVNDWPASVL